MHVSSAGKPLRWKRPCATVSPVQDELNEAIRAADVEANARAIAILDGDASLIKACDREGRTPLHVACEALNEPMVRWLLEHGADVKRRDTEDCTPLDRAVGEGGAVDAERFAAVAGLLRRHGAELTPRAAVALGEADWLRDRHAEERLTNPVGPPGGLLSIAVRHDQPDMLALLLEMGFDPEERMRVSGIEQHVESAGMPLATCATLGRHAMAEMLLEHGADPNSYVYASGTPMSGAYGEGDGVRRQEMIDLLKRHGGRLPPGKVGLFRETELGRAMLIEADGAAPNAGRDSVAEQLLWGAAWGGDPELVRLALERIDWARDDSRWFKMLVQPLRTGNYHSGDPNRGSDRGTYMTCFRLVLERCDPNIRTRFNMTMLHRLIGRYGRSDYGLSDAERAAFAALLLDAGARLDMRDELLASTPLGWACRWGRVEVVKLLLERGAPAVEPDAEPWAQPLAWATRYGHQNVLRLLRGHIT
ncbi:MAG: ankyrin repeat domain-containing protein [Phycisphaeraceae bacterium]